MLVHQSIHKSIRTCLGAAMALTVIKTEIHRVEDRMNIRVFFMDLNDSKCSEVKGIE